MLFELDYTSPNLNKTLNEKENKMVAFNNAIAPAGSHASTLNFAKAQTVQTGQRLNFSKENPTCTNVRIELYWTGNYDGDAAVVVLGANKRALAGELPQQFRKFKCNPNMAYQPTRGLAWYGCYDIQGISHSGDALTSDNDPTTPEEVIKVQMNNLDTEADSVLIVASTYPVEGTSQPVPFGRLRSCKVLIVNDDTNDVIYQYELSEDFSTHTSVELACFYKRNGDWIYSSMAEGVGTSTHALQDIAHKYGLC